MSYLSKIIFATCIVIFVPNIACTPKLVRSTKNIQLIFANSELKNWWIVLNNYHTKHGKFPDKIENLDTNNDLDPSKIKYVYPDKEILIESKRILPSGKVLRLMQDGEIKY
jgi:hypothetical protein